LQQVTKAVTGDCFLTRPVLSESAHILHVFPIVDHSQAFCLAKRRIQEQIDSTRFQLPSQHGGRNGCSRPFSSLSHPNSKTVNHISPAATTRMCSTLPSLRVFDFGPSVVHGRDPRGRACDLWISPRHCTLKLRVDVRWKYSHGKSTGQPPKGFCVRRQGGRFGLSHTSARTRNRYLPTFAGGFKSE
jgi:hypothetical protein